MKGLLRLVAVLGLLAVPAAAHAQVSGGVRVGLNLADLAVTPAPQTGSERLQGLGAGVFAIITINDIVAVQPEALYSMQGTKLSAAGTTLRTKIDYFQIPLLGRFRVARRSPIAVLAGTSFGIKTHASLDVPGAPGESVQGFEDTVRSFDFGIVAGASADAGRHLVLDARYTWGLTNFEKYTSVAAGETEGSAKHRVLSFSAGIRF